MQNGLAKAFYLLTKTYSNVLTSEHWRLIVWNLRALSESLRFCEIEEECQKPFTDFIEVYGLHIFHHIKTMDSTFG